MGFLFLMLGKYINMYKSKYISDFSWKHLIILLESLHVMCVHRFSSKDRLRLFIHRWIP